MTPIWLHLAADALWYLFLYFCFLVIVVLVYELYGYFYVVPNTRKRLLKLPEKQRTDLLFSVLRDACAVLERERIPYWLVSVRYSVPSATEILSPGTMIATSLFPGNIGTRLSMPYVRPWATGIWLRWISR
uniref:Uncharacterized protein n=1 Tax=Candidatus Kentrum sp. FW TaxID=2126338 RepID=A0A450SZS7_9GAMM|nr:MAG: hypothetical protein BECKFW1821A_GA0114235_10947 [Candidatus Kentron sp. FW]